MKKFVLIGIACFFVFGFSNKYNNLIISIETVFNNEPIVLNNKQYVNDSGDTLTIETFKFYLSNFSIYNNGKKYVVPERYFLVDAEKEESKKVVLPGLMQQKIDSIEFFIGVDSTASVSGALDGALDPMNGMFWAWNTGYINAKLEGKSNSCKTLHHAFEFHIGGYLRPYDAIRRVVLKTNSYSLRYTMKADAAKWFSGKQVNLKEFNSVMFPCKNALMVANNYANMFSLSQ